MFLICFRPTNYMAHGTADSTSASREILRFHETKRFITILTKTCHQTLSTASSWIQYSPSDCTSQRTILIIYPHLYLGVPWGFPIKMLYAYVSHFCNACSMFRQHHHVFWRISHQQPLNVICGIQSSTNFTVLTAGFIHLRTKKSAPKCGKCIYYHFSFHRKL
jgi:hypothetical protein